MEITPKQIRTLEKLQKFLKEGDMAMIDHIFELEDKVDEKMSEINDIAEEIRNLIPEVKDGEDGEDYVLTEEDKQAISDLVMSKITVPVAEKIIEKIQVIKEQPIVTEIHNITNEIKEVAVTDEPDVIVDKVNKSNKKISSDRVDMSEVLGKLSETDRIAKANALPITTTFVNGKRAKNIQFEGSTVTHAGDTATVTSTGGGSGTVTNVFPLTIGTTGTDLSSTVADGTTTPAITLQVPTASATNRGALSSADWSTFNGKMTNPMIAKNDIIIGDTGGVPIRLAENNTADPFALISQGNGTSQPISWKKTIGDNAVNGINNATNLITASNPVIETTGLTSILSAYAKRIYADYPGSANVAAADTYIRLSGASITATLQTPTAGQIHYFVNTSGGDNTIDTSGGETIGQQGTPPTSITIKDNEVLGVVGDGSNWLYLNARTHSDVYAPTLTGVTNITSLVLKTASWERIGNKVNVDLVVDAEPTSNNTQTTFGIDLPIAKTFANNYDVCGMGHSVDGTANQHGCAIYADVTNDRAEVTYYETHGATDTLNLHFTYIIDA
jgi:hypothetical protein